MKRAGNAAASLIGAACAAFCITAAHAAEPQTCRDVRMAGPGWTDIDATNAMAGVVLKALGYRQDVSNLSLPITYQGLKKGQVDVFLGNWMPAQGPLVKPFVDERSIDVLHANLSGAKFTLAVPDYVAAAGVRSFADLERFADRFGGRIYGIEPGAPANQNIKRLLADHALGPANWSLVESSETGMLTQVERAVRDRRWVVFLAWEPHLMNTKFRLTYLSGGDAYFGPDYGGATVNTVARAGFAGQCANLARLFRQMTFTVGIENRMIADMLDHKTPPALAAQRVLKADPALVAGWLDGVTTADGAPGLPAVRAALDGR
ncbi:glycine/betaine ABC transporter substrate-binding protein [Burkholderia stagnalis]|uniref:Choline ABC transporter substrate-binding protein n=1 Tax=Burkholderia stagnalis TaxID=1503054 RepID=A0A6L3N329_9BURK|nr:choline ABC transporter substrate-binding protein [Burkholderia stagnalis]KAB0640370.1 choline ABC transporter substrate-binding protein [Burkholderia stagnalis]KVO39488.1 glycine/betaine ABC transporter substrate-binding protein [Burkholderia stagnalis]KVO74730.1 glycine/betaine ABC transporter substrate-binding protein [Burkholderia stagnalis]KVW57674.1 glycine/betaine ABC transporter substrate-binding protein [Burkholderia stagnalis]KVW71459.1 glycine/betaine ABC transporter substrate-bi